MFLELHLNFLQQAIMIAIKRSLERMLVSVMQIMGCPPHGLVTEDAHGIYVSNY